MLKLRPCAVDCQGGGKEFAARFTVSQINEKLAKRGRPPRIEHIPAMLRDLGYEEVDNHWKIMMEGHERIKQLSN